MKISRSIYSWTNTKRIWMWFMLRHPLLETNQYHFLSNQYQLCFLSGTIHCLKVSKYGVFSGPYFPVFGADKTPYLDTFYTQGFCQDYDRCGHHMSNVMNKTTEVTRSTRSELPKSSQNLKKTLCWSLFFNKVTDCGSATFLHRWFLQNFSDQFF